MTMGIQVSVNGLEARIVKRHRYRKIVLIKKRITKTSNETETSFETDKRITILSHLILTFQSD